MLKPLLGITAGGVLTVVLWKILALALPPLVGAAVGVVFWFIKALVMVVGILVAVLLLAWINRRMSRQASAGSQ